jgi:hypothetical protein
MTTGNLLRAKADTVTLCSTCESFDLVYGKVRRMREASMVVGTNTDRKDAHIIELVQKQLLMFPPDLVVGGQKLWEVSHMSILALLFTENIR